ncbi:hypothetical protein PHMEG_00031746, partial [Phytophthora megakarya]
SKECNEFNNSNYDGNGIIYKRDQYWNKTTSIPSQASVLLMSGTLDPTTPIKYAESLLKSLKGTKKELIKFDFATHSTIFSTQMIPGSLDTCGMRVLASYVRNGGDLQSLNKSCVNKLSAFNLTVPDGILSKYFGTKDAYDGAFNLSFIFRINRGTVLYSSEHTHFTVRIHCHRFPCFIGFSRDYCAFYSKFPCAVL